MASYRTSRSTGDRSHTSGSDSGGTNQIVSPAMPKGSWLVARIFKPGQVRNKASASAAQASMRCSQLSRTRSRSLVSRCARSTSLAGRPGASRTPTAEATACGTRSGSESGASSTHHTPSSKQSTISVASTRAKRVLPEPPAPVRVSRRVLSANTPLSSAISRSRPTKLVSCRGRLFFGGGLDPCPRGKSMSWPLSSGGALPDGCVGSGIASLLPTFLSGLTALYTLCSAPERLTLRTTSLCAFGRYLQKDSKFSVPKPLQSVTSDVSSYQSVGAKLNRHN